MSLLCVVIVSASSLMVEAMNFVWRGGESVPKAETRPTQNLGLNPLHFGQSVFLGSGAFQGESRHSNELATSSSVFGDSTLPSTNPSLYNGVWEFDDENLHHEEKRAPKVPKLGFDGNLERGAVELNRSLSTETIASADTGAASTEALLQGAYSSFEGSSCKGSSSSGTSSPVMPNVIGCRKSSSLQISHVSPKCSDDLSPEPDDLSPRSSILAHYIDFIDPTSLSRNVMTKSNHRSPNSREQKVSPKNAKYMDPISTSSTSVNARSLPSGDLKDLVLKQWQRQTDQFATKKMHSNNGKKVYCDSNRSSNGYSNRIYYRDSNICNPAYHIYSPEIFSKLVSTLNYQKRYEQLMLRAVIGGILQEARDDHRRGVLEEKFIMSRDLEMDKDKDMAMMDYKSAKATSESHCGTLGSKSPTLPECPITRSGELAEEMVSHWGADGDNINRADYDGGSDDGASIEDNPGLREGLSPNEFSNPNSTPNEICRGLPPDPRAIRARIDNLLLTGAPDGQIAQIALDSSIQTPIPQWGFDYSFDDLAEEDLQFVDEYISMLNVEGRKHGVQDGIPDQETQVHEREIMPDFEGELQDEQLRNEERRLQAELRGQKNRLESEMRGQATPEPQKNWDFTGFRIYEIKGWYLMVLKNRQMEYDELENRSGNEGEMSEVIGDDADENSDEHSSQWIDDSLRREDELEWERREQQAELNRAQVSTQGNATNVYEIVSANVGTPVQNSGNQRVPMLQRLRNSGPALGNGVRQIGFVVRGGVQCVGNGLRAVQHRTDNVLNWVEDRVDDDRLKNLEIILHCC